MEWKITTFELSQSAAVGIPRNANDWDDGTFADLMTLSLALERCYGFCLSLSQEPCVRIKVMISTNSLSASSWVVIWREAGAHYYLAGRSKE
jgi:hypothetical protein